ncbi:hypothetical protein [Hymenobacter sp. B81]|uniref:hypothetical protein n=1 Tax=Hymenobacter sp. B81 TaxID=3344878 RepID=UPI0037DD7FFB
MKRLLLIAALLGPALAFGQAAPNFCGVEMPLAAGCTTATGYELNCNDFELRWAYLNYNQMAAVLEGVTRDEKKKHKAVEQVPLQGFILDSPAKGYRLSYVTESGGYAYQLIFTAVAKGQPVLVQLTMGIPPERTSDLPEAARRILRLER